MVLVNLSQTPSQQIEFNFFGFVSFFRQLSPLFIIRIGLIPHTIRWTTFWGEDQCILLAAELGAIPFKTTTLL
jgi:hypothetical protein